MNKFKQGFETLQRFSGFLLIGTVLALIWANANPEQYKLFVDSEMFNIHHPLYFLGHFLTHGKPFSFHFAVNDIFMVLFFGLAAKEVSESFLPGGALSSVKKASMPAIATLGGVLGPIVVFFTMSHLLAPDPQIKDAWAVPTATDIAYCWLFAQLIFGRSHPAVTFLLVLAVLDDMIGMLIIAVFYTPEVHIAYLGLVALAVVICEIMRRSGVTSFWPYVIIGGPLSWYGLHATGVHAALALVPIVPFMPHAARDSGLFVSASKEDDHGHDHDEEHGHGHNDTLNQFEHFFKPIVDVGLFTFGMANAGVILSGDAFTSKPTMIIFLSLLIGKTLGIVLFSTLGRLAGLELPKPMVFKEVPVLGAVAGIGFTVALFVTTVAMGNITGPLHDAYEAAGTAGQLKLGALLSFAAGPIAFGLARVLGLRKINSPEELQAAMAAAGATPDASDGDHAHDEKATKPAPAKAKPAADEDEDEDDDADVKPATTAKKPATTAKKTTTAKKPAAKPAPAKAEDDEDEDEDEDEDDADDKKPASNPRRSKKPAEAAAKPAAKPAESDDDADEDEGDVASASSDDADEAAETPKPRTNTRRRRKKK